MDSLRKTATYQLVEALIPRWEMAKTTQARTKYYDPGWNEARVAKRYIEDVILSAINDMRTTAEYQSLVKGDYSWAELERICPGWSQFELAPLYRSDAYQFVAVNVQAGNQAKEQLLRGRPPKPLPGRPPVNPEAWRTRKQLQIEGSARTVTQAVAELLKSDAYRAFVAPGQEEIELERLCPGWGWHIL
jgi:hypothetical protein